MLPVIVLGAITETMFKKKHIISKSQIVGIVRQLRYLMDTKRASDAIVGWKLRIILSDLGIDIEEMSAPPPDKKLPFITG